MRNVSNPRPAPTRRPNRQARRRASSGFTLIELLLVLMIIVVLAGVVVPSIRGRTEDARKTAAKADITNLDAGLDQFEMHTGRLPTNDEGLAALLDPPNNVQSWKGPYFKKAPRDPWGNPYQYRNPGQQNKYGVDLFSTGPDGREGGSDDVDNWSDGTPAK